MVATHPSVLERVPCPVRWKDYFEISGSSMKLALSGA
jgi:hypothetical protein